jgi:hypothetical protein
MAKHRWIGFLVLPGCVALAASMSVAMAGRDVEGAPNSSNAVSRDVLVAGAGSIASGKAPAVITVDLAARGETKQAQLELSISPVKVATNEAYVIVATQVDSAETGKELGSFSFFPPPREGEIRRYLVDLPSISPEMKAAGKTLAKVSIRLVPVDSAKPLVSSSVRIVGASIVTG